MAASAAVKAALAQAAADAVVTTTGTGPAAVSAGACTLSCPGLTCSANTALPSIVTETPSTVVGALEPLKSLPFPN